MMFELLLDVVDRFLNLRDTNAECAIALLPSKDSEVWKGLMNPSRRSCLYQLNGLGNGQSRRQGDKKMDMVGDAANAFRDHSILLSDTTHVRPEAFLNIRIQNRNTFLGAENAMN